MVKKFSKKTIKFIIKEVKNSTPIKEIADQCKISEQLVEQVKNDYLWDLLRKAAKSGG